MLFSALNIDTKQLQNKLKNTFKIKKESEVKTVEKAYKYRTYPNKKQKEIIQS